MMNIENLWVFSHLLIHSWSILLLLSCDLKIVWAKLNIFIAVRMCFSIFVMRNVNRNGTDCQIIYDICTHSLSLCSPISVYYTCCLCIHFNHGYCIITTILIQTLTKFVIFSKISLSPVVNGTKKRARAKMHISDEIRFNDMDILRGGRNVFNSS